MKLLISGSELSSAVPWLAKVTDHSVPSLAGIRITASERVSLFATNGESFATVMPPATVLDEGSALVSARCLDSIAKTLGRSEVTISSDGSRVTIERGTTRWTLPEIDASYHPRMPILGEELGRLPGERLKGGIRQVLIAVARNAPDAVKVTSGVEFTLGESLTLAASDRRRVATVELDWQRSLTAPEQALVVPESLLTLPLGILDTKEVRLHTDGNLLGFATDHFQVFGRLFAEPFLAWRRIIPPPEKATTVVTVDIAELLEKVKDASVFSAGDDHLRLSFDSDVISIISCNAKEEDGETHLAPDEFTGSPITIWCQPHYFTEALKVIPSETTVIRFGRNPWDAITLRPVEGNDYCHLLGTLKTRAAMAWAEEAA